jgi:hypothetical protein
VTLYLPRYEIPEGVQPGDAVDLVFTMDIVDSSSQVSVSGTAQSGNISAQGTVRDARIIWIGEAPIDGLLFRSAPQATPIGSRNPNTQNSSVPNSYPTTGGVIGSIVPITLGVTPQDGVLIIWAKQSNVPITLMLRSASATDLPRTTTVNLDYLINTYGVRINSSRYTLESGN